MARFRVGACWLIAATALSALTLVFAAQRPPSSQRMLAHAEKQAAVHKKNVLVIFGASWCGWCKKLEAYIAMPHIREVFDRDFVIVHLTVQERGRMAALDSPGGEQLMTDLGGKGVGLPFFAILSPDGRLIVNSNRPNSLCSTGKSNIGFPGTPQENSWFLTMLDRGAPNFSAGDRRAISAGFRAVYPNKNLTLRDTADVSGDSGPLGGKWMCSLRQGTAQEMPFILDFQIHGKSVKGSATSCEGVSSFEEGTFTRNTLAVRLDDGSSLTGKLMGPNLAGETRLKGGKVAWDCRRPVGQQGRK